MYANSRCIVQTVQPVPILQRDLRATCNVLTEKINKVQMLLKLVYMYLINSSDTFSNNYDEFFQILHTAIVCYVCPILLFVNESERVCLKSRIITISDGKRDKSAQIRIIPPKLGWLDNIIIVFQTFMQVP